MRRWPVYSEILGSIVLLCCFVSGACGFSEESHAAKISAPPKELSIINEKPVKTRRTHGLSIHGEPKYPADFNHFAYVNPNAPKGGKLTRNGRKFNNFNPFTIKGDKPTGMWYAVARLMSWGYDEIGTYYCWLCTEVEVPSDNMWIRFYLRKNARFSDGSPITAADVEFTHKKLVEKNPNWEGYLKDIKEVVVENPHQILFKFKHGNNNELPVIIGGLPVHSKKFWEKRDLDKTTMDVPPFSGAYKPGKFEQGSFFEWELVKDFWAKDLPVRKGFYNIEVLRYEIYQDQQVEIEALKKGMVDVFYENDVDRWHRAFDFKQIKSGHIKKEIMSWDFPPGMEGLVFNLRRKVFADIRVRKALTLLFEAEWKNKAFLYGEYTRVRSFFQSGGLEAKGLPEGEEKAILELFRGGIPDSVFTVDYQLPKNDTADARRANAKEALRLLAEAGYEYRQSDRKLVLKETGKQLSFEILLGSNRHERNVLPFANKLKRFGIDAVVRMMEGVAYEKRSQTYDYDMIIHGYYSSNSPGNEQRNSWSSEYADKDESGNAAGLKFAAIDEIVERLILATTRKSLEAHTRALDRVLQHTHFIIPFWDFPAFRMVYWDRIGMPEKSTYSGKPSVTWWIDPTKDKRIQAYREAQK